MDNFRDPTNKYMKIEDIIGMSIPLYSPIELAMSPNCQTDVDRGNIRETRVVYFAGTEIGQDYDKLLYHEALYNGQPIGESSGIMLPLIDKITPLYLK